MTDADTLRMIRDSAESIATFNARRLRELRNTAPGFDRTLWREMADQGWLSMMLSEDAGGLDLGLDAAAIIARALGAAATPEPYVAAGLVAPAILSECENAREHLSQISSGQQVACLAWQNPSGQIDVNSNDVAANASSNGVTLSGECRFVPVAHADAFIVLATNGDRPGLYWLPAGTTGLSVTAEEQADGGSSGWLRLKSAELSVDYILAEADRATEIVTKANDIGTIAMCTELMGMMDSMLNLTIDYLKTRKQFGRPIGSFQVLQHRTVDLWMHKEVADHATAAALRIVGDKNTSSIARSIAASSAKARVGEVALRMSNETVQLHGAIGFTDEYDLGLYVNRTLTLVPYLGNAAEHRARYGVLKRQAGALQ